VVPAFPRPPLPCDPGLKLREEVLRSIRAISQEYAACFAKEKDYQEDRRHTALSSISTLKLNEINKRKEQFLNEFVSSGKFSTLKDRLSKSIRSVVIDKFRKEK
jgi:hypothetical protein